MAGSWDTGLPGDGLQALLLIYILAAQAHVPALPSLCLVC